MTDLDLQLIAILRGPKISDRKISEILGLTHEQAIRLHHDLRVKLGVNTHRESLRDFVRRNKLLPILAIEKDQTT